MVLINFPFSRFVSTRFRFTDRETGEVI
ncbi:MAG: hypothetical protein RIT46_1205, partial [Pseudomonadota bacterium]